ncbi:ARGLU domain containing protein [Trichuris trichiura]|uniref:ARGLU domain containing protein n=1 Tax=Trichuris trichiura TaxID=36087 RepID=A0A077Z7Z7_TRITR|nr:ARGLU domain containing protein [Trichuris trichiura]
MRSRSRSRRRDRRSHRRSRSTSKRHRCRRHRDRSSEYGGRRSREKDGSFRRNYARRSTSRSSLSGTLSEEEIEKLVRREKRSKRKEAASLISPAALPVVEVSPSSHNHAESLEVNKQHNCRTCTPVASLDDELVRRRVEELVNLRLAEIDAEVERRVAAAKAELEIQTRTQIDAELQEEIRSCQRREASFMSICSYLECKQRCEELEQQLKSKMKELEETKQKLDEDRLEMLKARQEIEAEKIALRQEREKFVKQEQAVILGKAGTRPKLKFTLAGGIK